MPLRLFDAHNHLQDERLRPFIVEILRDLPSSGFVCAVVNGSAEDDWEAVAELARMHSWIRPSFGLHPWYVKQRSPQWKDALSARLAEFPDAGVGEIGLDRWIDDPQIESQIDAFRWQLEKAAELGRPASIHCLRAWGLLEETLKTSRRPERGFLLHSYGGPGEMIPSLAKLGAYFSLSPYFLHERKSVQREVFKLVPLDRLLAESDAPDMRPPDSANAHPLCDTAGRSLNHPANIELSYRLLAELRGMSLNALASQLEQNFHQLFS